jgi:hypothetical protein
MSALSAPAIVTLAKSLIRVLGNDAYFLVNLLLCEFVLRQMLVIELLTVKFDFCLREHPLNNTF